MQVTIKVYRLRKAKWSNAEKGLSDPVLDLVHNVKVHKDRPNEAYNKIWAIDYLFRMKIIDRLGYGTYRIQVFGEGCRGFITSLPRTKITNSHKRLYEEGQLQ